MMDGLLLIAICYASEDPSSPWPTSGNLCSHVAVLQLKRPFLIATVVNGTACDPPLVGPTDVKPGVDSRVDEVLDDLADFLSRPNAVGAHGTRREHLSDLLVTNRRATKFR